MAYVRPFIRLSFGGTLADQNEIWSCNVHLVDATPVSDPEAWFLGLNSFITEYGDEVSSFVSNPNALVPSGVNLGWVKMALIGTDGKYMLEPIEEQRNTNGANAFSYLPQGALVNTLMSDVWKDPGRYNRFYLPCTLTGAAGAYQLSGTQQNNYADALRDFVEGLNAVDTSGVGTDNTVVGVVSNTRSGSTRGVIGVRVGRVIDTQRRRRNSLTEAYVDREINPI